MSQRAHELLDFGGEEKCARQYMIAPPLRRFGLKNSCFSRSLKAHLLADDM
jgi:hypothetical protein